MKIPIWLKIFVYFLLATGTQFVTATEDINPALMDRFQWARLFVGVLVAGLIAVKAFIDVSYANSVYDVKKVEKLKEETAFFAKVNTPTKPEGNL